MGELPRHASSQSPRGGRFGIVLSLAWLVLAGFRWHAYLSEGATQRRLVLAVVSTALALVFLIVTLRSQHRHRIAQQGDRDGPSRGEGSRHGPR